MATLLLQEGFAMKITTLSSREFNQDTSRAKKAATEGPVFITDRGTPAHVLLSIQEYQRLTGGQGSIVDRLGLPPGIEDVELEIPPMRDLAGPADFT
jgi:prevent-host-death family protein